MELRRSTFFQNFTPVPDELFDQRCDLTRTEMVVYIVYLKHTDRNTGVAWPGNERVAEMARISIPSLKRTTAILEAKGYISKQARYNDKGQQLSNFVIVHHPLETDAFWGGIKNDTPPESGEGIKNNTPLNQGEGIKNETPGGIKNNTQTILDKNHIEEEESKIAVQGNEMVQIVKDKLQVEHMLASHLVDKCGDKKLLEKVLDQLTNAKKPIQNMTAYLLTLIANPDQWRLFVENVENEFLTRERPVKKREPKMQKPFEEKREIYFPPSMLNG